MPSKLKRNRIIAATLALAPLATAQASSLIPEKNDPRLKPATVLVSAQHAFTQVVIDGYIHKPTVEAFRQRASLSGDQYGIVIFNSAGGDPEAAMELGRLIRASGYATQIGKLAGHRDSVEPGVCESACPIAFAGGKFRLLDDHTGKLGVHRIYVAKPGRWADDSRKLFDGEKRLSAYFSEMGIDPEFLEIMRRTSSEEIRPISMKSAYHWKLATGREHQEWEKTSSGAISAIAESATGRMEIQFACNSGEIVLNAQFKPWFPTLALLNYDTHNIVINGAKHPVAEAKVGFAGAQSKTEYLTVETTVANRTLEALVPGASVGYSMSFEGGSSEYRRTIDSRGLAEAVRSLAEQCGGSHALSSS